MSINKIFNPDCGFGDNCSDNLEVRVLPTGGQSNSILCAKHFAVEIAWRKERNKELLMPDRFDLPAWECLPILKNEELQS